MSQMIWTVVHLCFILDGFYICHPNVIIYSIKLGTGMGWLTMEYELFVRIFERTMFIQLRTCTTCVYRQC